MNSGRIIFNPAKDALLVLLFVVIYCSSVRAQTDSTFSLLRDGVEAKFQFLKLTKPEQFKTIGSSSLPLYSFNQGQYNRIKGLLVRFTQMEKEYYLLLNNYHEKDLISATKEKAMIEEALLQEQRAKNFETSYNTLLGVNAQLNDQVKKAEQLAIREHKKRKLNSLLFGVVALSAGVAMGVTVR